MRIDLSLGNCELYKGLAIEDVAGRMNLATPPDEAVGIVGRNIAAMLSAVSDDDRDDVTLTGPMAVWAYLVVFHAVVHRFREVRYDDGRNAPIVIARHG